MKYRDLFEMPYHIDDDLPKSIGSTETISDSALTREYQLLNTEDDGIRQVRYWVASSNSHAIVTVEGKNKFGEDANQIVARIKFKPELTDSVPVQNPLQVDMVQVHELSANQGLTTTLYFALASSGYSVVSDLYQYTGGKMLWKKIARLSQAQGYEVRVWDQAINDWYPDPRTGKAITYTAKNLIDSEVWLAIEKQPSPTTLLVMTEK